MPLNSARSYVRRCIDIKYPVINIMLFCLGFQIVFYRFSKISAVTVYVSMYVCLSDLMIFTFVDKLIFVFTQMN